VHLYREQDKTRKKSCIQVAPFTLEICRFLLLKSKYTSCLTVPETSSALSWVSINRRKRLVVSVLLSILFQMLVVVVKHNTVNQLVSTRVLLAWQWMASWHQPKLSFQTYADALYRRLNFSGSYSLT